MKNLLNKPQTNSGGKRKLLYVDDDSQMLSAVERQLRNYFEIKTWNAPVSPAGFDCALIDWDPHGMAQVMLCELLHVPFVIYTANPDAVPPGHRFVTKPATKELLISTIEGVMQC